MKLHTTASILTGILWVFWVVPLEGKKLCPQIFDSSAIQWASAFIVAILIPFVVLMALSIIFTGARRRVGFGIAVLACLPLLYNLTMYGIGATMFTRITLNLQGAHQRDSAMIATLTDRAVSEDTAENRAKSAGLLYTMFGVQPASKDAEGNLARYYPTVGIRFLP